MEPSPFRSFSLVMCATGIFYVFVALAFHLWVGLANALMASCLFCVSWVLAVHGRTHMAKFVFLGTAFSSLTLSTIVMSSASGLPVFTLVCGSIWASMADDGHFGSPLTCFVVVATTIGVWVFLDMFADSFPFLHESISLEHLAQANFVLFRLIHVTSIVLLCLFIFWQRTIRLRRDQELAHERHRIDSIISSLLPQEIANRLKRGDKHIATWHPLACVMFLDIVGFTDLCGRMSAKQLVQGLAKLFSEIESFIAKFPKVEKIKTIGDAMMCASGVISGGTADDIVDIAKLTLLLRSIPFKFEFVDLLEQPQAIPLQFRFGINCGEVVAGVMSNERFTFDIFGETVNLAARMQSLSAPGKILVTDAVRAQLLQKFEFEDNGIIVVKGKGLMQTWFLRDLL